MSFRWCCSHNMSVRAVLSKMTENSAEPYKVEPLFTCYWLLRRATNTVSSSMWFIYNSIHPFCKICLSNHRSTVFWTDSLWYTRTPLPPPGMGCQLTAVQTYTHRHTSTHWEQVISTSVGLWEEPEPATDNSKGHPVIYSINSVLF